MKVFWISLILFSLVLAFTAINARFLHRTVWEMEALIDRAESGEAELEAVEALETLWEEKRDRISLSVGRRKVQAVDEGLIELRWAMRQGDPHERQRAGARLRSSLEELARRESLHVASVF